MGTNNNRFYQAVAEKMKPDFDGMSEGDRARLISLFKDYVKKYGSIIDIPPEEVQDLKKGYSPFTNKNGISGGGNMTSRSKKWNGAVEYVVAKAHLGELVTL
jgi:hypothetical protein